jgi:hypothetical protein
VAFIVEAELYAAPDNDLLLVVDTCRWSVSTSWRPHANCFQARIYGLKIHAPVIAAAFWEWQLQYSVTPPRKHMTRGLLFKIRPDFNKEIPIGG